MLGGGGLYSKVQVIKYELISSLCHQMSLQGHGPLQRRRLGPVGVGGRALYRGWNLYNVVQYIMGNGHI